MTTDTSDVLGGWPAQVPSVLQSIRRIIVGARRRLRLSISVLVVGILIIVAIVVPYVAPSNPLNQDLSATLQAPSLSHPFGTDQLGRDVLSRSIYGARTSLTVAAVATAVATCFGATLGVLSGYAGRWLDNFAMGLIEVFFAFPFILLALLIVAFLGPGQTNTIIAMCFTGWIGLARVTRGQTLALKNEPFVEAARVVGCPSSRLVFRHILPQLTSTITVLATVEVSRMILLEGSLSFLGLGVALPQPSWGNMLSEAKNYLSVAWWMTAFPGLLFTITVLAITQLGDGLRDLMDPALRGR